MSESSSDCTPTLDDYDYALPKRLIAQFPLEQRSDARLMLVDRASQSIDHWHVRDLPELLQPGDCLVLNDTKVIPAKLVGYRTATGGRWTGLYVRSDDQGHAEMLCKTRGRVQPGETITLQNRQGQDDVRLTLLARLGGGTWAVSLESDEPMLDVLRRIGRVPLPHYIRDGNMRDSDVQAYQTVYASADGAVAAPTAGLHFTRELLQRVHEQGVHLCRVTLHVGLGTFRPIQSQQIDAHEMHSEWGSTGTESIETIRACQAAGKRVIAVGTTAVRVLETAGAEGEIQPWEGETDLFIHPPYSFRVVDGLMTNFHLPKTSLLVLIRTFGGDALMRRAYEEAIAEEYRFFSYGDAMLIV